MNAAGAALLTSLALSLLATPLAAEAQQPGKVYRIAIMSPADPVTEMTEAGDANYKAFFSELRRLGYVEGRNLVVERRSGGGQTARYPEFALEVVQRQPHLIFALTGRVAKAFQAATTTIPIVAIAGDPIVDNIVPSLARPGGNLTGFSADAGEQHGKHLELLKEMVPTASRVAFLSPRAGWELPSSRAMRQAFNRTGLTLIGALLDDPIQEAEYRRAFVAMVRERVEALVVGDFGENYAHRQLIVELAAQSRLPTIYPFRAFVDVGGLIAYSVDVSDLFRRVAGYIDRIFKGANPGELPYEMATKIQLAINLKTAKALGLTIPPSVLARADEVIQ